MKIVHKLPQQEHYTSLAKVLKDKGLTTDQAYQWLKSKQFVVKGYYFKAKRVIANMYNM